MDCPLQKRSEFTWEFTFSGSPEHLQIEWSSRVPFRGAKGGNILCMALYRFLWLLSSQWGSLSSVVSTLYLLNESQEHLVLSRLHPMLTLVPGYVLKEFGTLHLDWSC